MLFVFFFMRTTMTSVDVTANAMAAGLTFVSAALLILTFDARGALHNKAVVASVLIFVIVSFTAYGFVFNDIDVLFNKADNAITALNEVVGTNRRKCKKNINEFIDTLLTPRVRVLLNIAEPVLERRRALLATLGGSLGAVAFCLTYGIIKSPSPRYLSALARIASSVLIVSFVVMLLLSTITEIFYTYKRNYQSDILEFQDAVKCCQSTLEFECLLNTTLINLNMSPETNMTEICENPFWPIRGLCCLVDSVPQVCALSTTIDDLWKFDDETMQKYIQFALLSISILGSIACVALGHSQSRNTTTTITIKDGLVTFSLFWACVAFGTAVWETSVGSEYLLWLLWISPWPPLAIAVLLQNYLPNDWPTTNFKNWILLENLNSF